MKILFSKSAMVALLVLLGLVGYYFTKKRPNQQSWGEGQVERVDLEQRITLSGSIEPLHKAMIVAPYSGYIKKIYVQVGDIVKVGSPLLAMAQSLSSDEETHPLRSPIHGTVVQVERNEGEFVKGNDSSEFIVRIDDTSELFVKVMAAELDRMKILKDQDAILKPMALANQAFKAKVTSMALAANYKDRWDRSNVSEYKVLLKIQDPTADLHSGMSCLIDIVTFKKANVLTLRHEFILSEGDQSFALQSQGRRVPITLGLANDERAEIVSGLSEGAKVLKIDFASMIQRL